MVGCTQSRSSLLRGLLPAVLLWLGYTFGLLFAGVQAPRVWAVLPAMALYLTVALQRLDSSNYRGARRLLLPTLLAVFISTLYPELVLLLGSSSWATRSAFRALLHPLLRELGAYWFRHAFASVPSLGVATSYPTLYLYLLSFSIVGRIMMFQAPSYPTLLLMLLPATCTELLVRMSYTRCDRWARQLLGPRPHEPGDDDDEPVEQKPLDGTVQRREQLLAMHTHTSIEVQTMLLFFPFVCVVLVCV